MIRKGLTINRCEMSGLDYTVERPFRTNTETTRRQKYERIRAFRHLEKILKIHNSTKTDADILDSQIICHPVGVSQHYSGDPGERTVYKPSELQHLSINSTREETRNPCTTYVAVLKQQDFVVKNSQSYASNSICEMVNP